MELQVAEHFSWSYRWLNNTHGATGGGTILMELQVAEQSSWSYRWLNNPDGATGG
jgi:hypothetical protein